MANQGQNQSAAKLGIASMDVDKKKEIAKKAGETVPAKKRTFAQDPERAAEVGRKGGETRNG